jgi:hypothetical protein
MEPAITIRDSVAAVATLRSALSADPALQKALHAVKRLQARRFSGTYADLLRSPVYQRAARFLLEELYGDKDYTQRDAQFARIAGAIERFFPAQVVQTAVSLARLHALTEDLDVQLARMWLSQAGVSSEAGRYARSWRALGRREERNHQLAAVVALGQELARVTRTAGVRTMLRLMRGPAVAGGLGELQRFLESGFDTFAAMAKRPGAAEQFLATIADRESRLMDLLDTADLVACETELERLLGQAP